MVGTRPELVKANPVSMAFADVGIHELIVHTQQHHDDALSGQFLDELALPEPAHLLGVGSGSHAAQTARAMIGIERVLLDERPDAVLVYGDTNSTLAAALAAAKCAIPLLHVEAGLRSFNRAMPEEHNRVVTDHLSDVLFVPTGRAMHNLAAEGIVGDHVVLVGDVNLDASLDVAKRGLDDADWLNTLGLPRGGFVLATVHRAENTDDPERLRTIFVALDRLAADLPVVLPLHPRTARALAALPAAPALGPLLILEPVGFSHMSVLERAAAVIVTDSGGVQKEAFVHRTPCVTVRDETEWVELVELGWNRVVPPTDAGEIEAAVRAAIGSQGAEAAPYGAGDAASRIAREIVERFR